MSPNMRELVNAYLDTQEPPVQFINDFQYDEIRHLIRTSEFVPAIKYLRECTRMTDVHVGRLRPKNVDVSSPFHDWLVLNNLHFVTEPGPVLGLKDAKDIVDVLRANLEYL